MEQLLEVKNLVTTFKTKHGTVKAVNDVSFSLAPGEICAIVGESGSGKSVTSMSILRLIAQNGTIAGGEILFEGEDLLKKTEKQMRAIRGKDISMIFQDPMSCLNPVFTIGYQLEEVLKLHNKSMKRRSAAPALWKCCGWSGCPIPKNVSSNTRTNCRAACASAS